LERDAESAGGAEPAAPCTAGQRIAEWPCPPACRGPPATSTCAEPVRWDSRRRPISLYRYGRVSPYRCGRVSLCRCGLFRWSACAGAACSGGQSVPLFPLCDRPAAPSADGRPDESGSGSHLTTPSPLSSPGTPGGGPAHPASRPGTPRIEARRSVCGGCWGHCGASEVPGALGEPGQGRPGSRRRARWVGRESWRWPAADARRGTARLRRGTARHGYGRATAGRGYGSVVAQRRWFAQVFGTQRSCPA
jgi:hypothetical protein